MQNWDGRDFTTTGKLCIASDLGAQRFIICVITHVILGAQRSAALTVLF
jgi:hypothetical protein